MSDLFFAIINIQYAINPTAVKKKVCVRQENKGVNNTYILTRKTREDRMVVMQPEYQNKRRDCREAHEKQSRGIHPCIKPGFAWLRKRRSHNFSYKNNRRAVFIISGSKQPI